MPVRTRPPLRFDQQPTVNVTAPSGSDLTSDINAALGQLAGQRSATVSLPTGTFTLGSEIVLPDGVTIRGQGPSSTIIQRSGNHHLFSVATTSNFVAGRICDLKLDGASTTTYDGVNFDNASVVGQFQLDNCFVTGFRRGYSGSNVDGTPNGFDKFTVLSKVIFDSCVSGVTMEEHVRVDHCTFNACTTGIGGRMTDCQIIGAKIWYCTNAITNPTSAGALAIIGSESYNCVVGFDVGSNVQIMGCTMSGSATLSGPSANAAATHGIKLRGVSNSVIGCRISGSMSNSAIASTTESTNYNTTISGNVLTLSGGHGIRGGGGGSQWVDSSVCNNTFEMQGGTTCYSAIYMLDTHFRRNVLTGNVSTQTGAGTNSNGLWYLPYTEDLMLGPNVFERVAGTCASAIKSDGGGLVRVKGLSLNRYIGITTPVNATMAITELTIATGAVTLGDEDEYTIDTESDAASDDLDTINGGYLGRVIRLRAANTARTPTLKDGTGNLKTGGDRALDNTEDTIVLWHDGTNWLEVSFANNGA